MGLLYAVLLAIPLVSIISRVIYVQSNKNAYQSYAGTTQQIESVDTYYQFNTNELNTYEDLIQGNIYYFTYDDELWTIRNNYVFLFFNYIYSLDGIYLNEELLSYELNEGNYCLYTENENDYIADSSLSYYLQTNLTNGLYFVFDYAPSTSYTILNNLIEEGFLTQSDYLGWEDFTINYTEVSYLDNVFEYSVDSIIQENNFGKIDFLSWFSNMFLDNNNAVNNRYVHFANWYMNYIMFVSCAYLLFLVLMWFINFARRLLDRGMNYDW